MFPVRNSLAEPNESDKPRCKEKTQVFFQRKLTGETIICSVLRSDSLLVSARFTFNGSYGHTNDLVNSLLEEFSFAASTVILSGRSFSSSDAALRLGFCDCERQRLQGHRLG